jgi:aerobic carbon-monoxide dehydrogenase small subunit
MTAKRTIQLTVNGSTCERRVEVRMTLADFLREELNLTGTHLGCEHGICGACTILLNGDAVRSCLMLAVQADGARLMTVEGLAQGEMLHPLQQAFHENHALQCGFCTPGFLMTAYAFVQETPHPTEDQVREAISGNICRCTGYLPIVQAIVQASAHVVPVTAPLPVGEGVKAWGGCNATNLHRRADQATGRLPPSDGQGHVRR